MLFMVSTPTCFDIGVQSSRSLLKQRNTILTTQSSFFYSRTVHLDIIKVLLPTTAQEKYFKRRIKIYTKTAPTCFGVITIIKESTI